MVCVVLAAGYATRLYPLTENFPKPLLEVQGKAILDWLLYDIDKMEEITGFVIISNHRYSQHFEAWKKDCKLTKPVTILDDGTTSNENRLGAVKDVDFAIDSLGLDDDLLVIAGDNILDFSFRSFITYFKEKDSSCIMRYYEESIPVLQKCGVVEIDENDLVTGMVEKPQQPATHWGVPPFYIYKKGDLHLVKKGIESGCATDAPGSFIVWLSQQSPVHAMAIEGKRYDIGDLESYEQVKKEFQGIQ